MMPILDSIKDPATGKIKTPILVSLIGGGGLFAYLLFKGSGSSSSTTTATGETTPLTPDLTGLQDALNKLAANAPAPADTTPPADTSGGSSSGSGGYTNGNPPSFLGPPVQAPPSTPPSSGSASSKSNFPYARNKFGQPVSPSYAWTSANYPQESGVSGGGGSNLNPIYHPSAGDGNVYGHTQPIVPGAGMSPAPPGYANPG